MFAVIFLFSINGPGLQSTSVPAKAKQKLRPNLRQGTKSVLQIKCTQKNNRGRYAKTKQKEIATNSIPILGQFLVEFRHFQARISIYEEWKSFQTKENCQKSCLFTSKQNFKMLSLETLGAPQTSAGKVQFFLIQLFKTGF